MAKFEEEAEQSGDETGDNTTGRDGFYGWMGFGGSVFQWNPELKIGYVAQDSKDCLCNSGF